MRVITWNLNSRTNKKDLTEQCDYLRKGDFDITTLRSLLGSEGFIKDYFANESVICSFDLVKDKSVLVNKRKYGQMIISKSPIINIEEFAPVHNFLKGFNLVLYRIMKFTLPMFHQGHRMELLKLNTLKVFISFYLKGMLRI